MAATLPAHLTQLESEMHCLQRRKSLYTVTGFAIAAVIAFIGIDMANRSNATPFSQGISKIFDFPLDMIRLSYELGFARWAARVWEFVPDLIVTLNMALLSTFLGFVFAVILACFASRNIMHSKTVVMVTRRMMDLFRSFPGDRHRPDLLVPDGQKPFAGGDRDHHSHRRRTWKTVSPKRSKTSTTSLWRGWRRPAAGWISRVRFGVFPQVMPLFFSYAILRLEINVRASTILGFFGAGGIGQALSTMIQWRDGGRVTAIFVLLVATIVALDYLSDWIRSKQIGKRL